MNKRSMNLLVKISVFSAMLIFLVLIFLKKGHVIYLKNQDYISLITLTVTITNIIVILFISKLWKIKWINKTIVKIPNLNGKWSGKLKSSYQNRNSDIEVQMHIKQNFYRITTEFRTEKSNSKSIVCSFAYDDEGMAQELIYTYNNDPKMLEQFESPMHFGTVIFSWKDEFPICLEGRYWTSRGTKGDINVKNTEFSN